jgi:hypothetical protein
VYTLELPKAPVKSDGTTGWEWMQFLRGKQKEEWYLAKPNTLAVL